MTTIVAGNGNQSTETFDAISAPVSKFPLDPYSSIGVNTVSEGRGFLLL